MQSWSKQEFVKLMVSSLSDSELRMQAHSSILQASQPGVVGVWPLPPHTLWAVLCIKMLAIACGQQGC